jgi:hypothetical protein
MILVCVLNFYSHHDARFFQMSQRQKASLATNVPGQHWQLVASVVAAEAVAAVAKNRFRIV